MNCFRILKETKYLFPSINFLSRRNFLNIPSNSASIIKNKNVISCGLMQQMEQKPSLFNSIYLNCSLLQVRIFSFLMIVF